MPRTLADKRRQAERRRLQRLLATTSEVSVGQPVETTSETSVGQLAAADAAFPGPSGIVGDANVRSSGQEDVLSGTSVGGRVRRATSPERAAHAARERARRATQDSPTRERARQRRVLSQTDADRQAEAERGQRRRLEEHAQAEANRLQQEREVAAARQANLEEAARIVEANEARRERRRLQAQVARDRVRQATLRQACNSAAVLAGTQRIPLFHIGAPSIICDYCSARKWPSETPSICCHGGIVFLQPIAQPIQYLCQLWTEDTPIAKVFRKNARPINCCLALASLSMPRPENDIQGNPNVVAQGRLYCNMGSLMPRSANSRPAFAQIYVNDPACADPAQEAELRLDNLLELDHDERPSEERQMLLEILMRLEVELRSVNTYCQSIICAAELLRTEGFQNAKLAIRRDARPPEAHRGRYNENMSEVAVLVGRNPGPQDVVLRLRDGTVVHIDERNRSYDPLHFVCLFPAGTDGWHPLIPLRPAPNRRQNDNDAQPPNAGRPYMSVLQYYKFLLHTRGDRDNLLLYSARLFQEFIVVSYAKVELARLTYLRDHQATLRREIYQNLVDTRTGDPVDQRFGTRIILPESFTDSPRHRHARYLDAMAIVHKFGPPSLFVTMTCNPKWPEIISQLAPGQTADNRPDLVARVFALKMNELISEIESGILGKSLATISVVEFQKRGLPHVHILVILAMEDRPRTPAQVDEMISAEIPRAADSPQAALLREQVLKHMMHTACLKYPSRAQCMQEGRCSKHFPKDFSEETVVSANDMYPTHRRREPDVALDNVHTISIPRQNDTPITYELDNRFVVPYNPYLLLRFQCHINVLICTSDKVVKYVFLYVYKGPDMQVITVDYMLNQPGDDEIQAFQDMRHLGASEACWRLYEFQIDRRYPSVLKLQIHLEGQHNIFYHEGQEPRYEAGSTTLIEWMVINRALPDNDPRRQLLYADFPSHYTWNPATKKWSPRRRQTGQIGRIVSVSPSQLELFYLRVLLQHVPGARSFVELRKVDGQDCDSNESACRRRGLLQHDAEWDRAMEDASSVHRPSQVRKLFVTILLFCQVTDGPAVLFERHLAIMAEGYRFLHPQLDSDMIRALVLLDLERRLQRVGKQLVDFLLPAVSEQHRQAAAALDERYSRGQQPPIIAEELELRSENVDDDPLATLLPSQRRLVDAVMTAVDTTPRAFFVNAAGGTGKTYTFNSLLRAVRNRGDVALAVASSGIAATLLTGGRTYHSRFKAPLKPDYTSTLNISVQSTLAELIRMAKVIVWDEAPMTHRHHLEALDRTLRDITETNTPFGGKVIVLGGDFRQVLPIVPRGSRPTIVDASIRRSHLWSHFTTFTLEENVRARQTGDTVEERDEFARWLLQLGNGTFPADAQDTITLPAHLVMPTNLQQVIDWTFENLDQNYSDPQWLTSRAILAPTNMMVDTLNDRITAIFPGTATHCYSADATRIVGENDTALDVPLEYVHTLTPSGFPRHLLLLKPKMPIMLLKNLDPTQGLCNGTRLVVVRVMSNRLLEAVIASGAHAGKTVLIPRISIDADGEEDGFKWQRRQFPVRCAFAFTINKSQGQTLERAVVWLETPVFGHGQLYVAASRVGSESGLRFAIPSRDGGKTKNVVFREALL